MQVHPVEQLSYSYFVAPIVMGLVITLKAFSLNCYISIPNMVALCYKFTTINECSKLSYLNIVILKNAIFYYA